MEENSAKFDLPYRSEFSAAMEKILAVTFMALAILGNTLIISAFLKHKTLRTVPNLLVVNLSILDTLAAFTTHPLLASVLIRGAWFFGHEVCKYQAILNSFLVIICHLSITLVSLNRYFIIVCHKKYTVIFTKRSCRRFLLAIWIISSCLALSHFMANEKFEFHAEEAVCVISRESSPTSVLTAVFGNIVFIATLSLNFVIFKSVQLHRKQVSITLNEKNAHVKSESDRGKQDISNSSRRRNRIASRNEVYITKKIIIVTSLYTLCWLPHGILKNASLGNVHIPRAIWMISTFSMQCSSLLNPVLYGFLNRKFRKAIFRMLGIRSRNVLQTSNFHTTRLAPIRLRFRQPFTVGGCIIETIGPSNANTAAK